MGNIPSNCVTCPYESSCNTALNLPDCRFYYMRPEKTSFIVKLANLFGKVFG
jgi:hypothetical protein